MEGSSCKTCKRADTKMMVQCDKCDQWFHFSCVGVSEDIADKSWSCTNCVTATWIQRTEAALENGTKRDDDNLERRSTRSQPIGNIATSTRSNLVIPPGNEVHKAASVDRNPFTSVRKSSTKVATDQIKADQQKQQWELSNRDSRKADVLIEDAAKALSEVSFSSSQKSAVSRARLQLMRLQEERESQQQQEERRRIAEEKATQEHRKYLEEKYRLLEEMLSEKGSRRSENGSKSRSEASSRVVDWVQKTSQIQQILPDTSDLEGINSNSPLTTWNQRKPLGGSYSHEFVSNQTPILDLPVIQKLVHNSTCVQ
nr:uncharacterized protein KIAA2012-like [Aedes albopictus]